MSECRAVARCSIPAAACACQAMCARACGDCGVDVSLQRSHTDRLMHEQCEQLREQSIAVRGYARVSRRLYACGRGGGEFRIRHRLRVTRMQFQ